MPKVTWSRIGLATATVGAVGVAGVALAVTSSPPASAAERLRGFDDCADLRNWYAQAALPQVTAWGLGGGGRMMPNMAEAPVAAAAEGAQRDAGSAPMQDAVGNGSTGTNVQERGVDEPDLAKTDGRHVVLVADSTLRIFDTAGESPRRIGQLHLPEARFSELLLVGDRAVLLGHGSGGAVPGTPYSGAAEPELVEPAEPELIGPDAPRPDVPRTDPPRPDVPWTGSTEAVIATVDLSDRAAPRLLNKEEIGGSVVSAREYDGTVRVVVSSTPVLPFVTPDSERSEGQALARNRELVRNATVEDWLPTRGGRPLLDCSDVRHPERPSGIGTLSVLTFSPDAPRRLSSVGVAADGDLVYSSTDRLYVATMRGGWTMPLLDRDGRPQTAEELRTQVHAFALDGQETTYTASGSVAGRVHGRWAFSEHDGRLRVATILGDGWRSTENAVSVLTERDGQLRVVGSVSGLGVTEQIRSVRWFGDLAVVVTFRQTDPLYTVDLTDPTQPEVRGELKIPGYSAYLHPLGQGRLLGVGQDATLEGQETGVQVSTFDLTELDHPKQDDTLALGRYTHTAVQEDSRAFTYLPERRLALLPVAGTNHALHAVEVSEDGALRSLTRVDLPRLHAGRVRALPLDDGRIAIATGAEVWTIVSV